MTNPNQGAPAPSRPASGNTARPAAPPAQKPSGSMVYTVQKGANTIPQVSGTKK